MTHPVDIERHPDIVSLRAHYEVAAANPIAQFADGLTLLAGLYLAISAWVVGFSGVGSITISNLVTGLAVSALALGFSSAFGRTHGIAWVSPILGVWTIISPWAIHGDIATTNTIWNNVVVGAVIVVMGLATVGVGLAGRLRPPSRR